MLNGVNCFVSKNYDIIGGRNAKLRFLFPKEIKTSTAPHNDFLLSEKVLRSMCRRGRQNHSNEVDKDNGPVI